MGKVDEEGTTKTDTSPETDKAPEGLPDSAPPATYSLDQVYGFAEMVNKDNRGRAHKAEEKLREASEGLQQQASNHASALKELQDRQDKQEEDRCKDDPSALTKLRTEREVRVLRDDNDRRARDLTVREAAVKDGAAANEKRSREIDLKDVATSEGVDITALEALAPQSPRDHMVRIAKLMKGSTTDPGSPAPGAPTTTTDSGKSQGGVAYTREQLSKMPMEEYAKIPKERRDV